MRKKPSNPVATQKVKTLKDIYCSLSDVITKAEQGRADYKDSCLIVNSANSMVRVASFALKMALLTNNKPDTSLLSNNK